MLRLSQSHHDLQDPAWSLPKSKLAQVNVPDSYLPSGIVLSSHQPTIVPESLGWGWGICESVLLGGSQEPRLLNHLISAFERERQENLKFKASLAT